MDDLCELQEKGHGKGKVLEAVRSTVKMPMKPRITLSRGDI